MYEAAEAAGELTPTGFSELQLGITYWFWRQTERSVQLQERALVSYRAAGDRHGVSLVLATLSMAQDSFDRAAAERSARQAIAIGRESGNPIEVCGGLLALAGVVAHSEAGRAADLAAEILEIANRAELIWYEATAARLRAHALSRAGRLSEASDAYARAIALNGVGDFGELLWYTVFNVVEHLARIGEPDAAAVALGAFREAPAAPSDDLIARATDRLARQVADTFGSDDLAVEAQERGRTMRLADLLRLLQQRLAAHATT